LKIKIGSGEYAGGTIKKNGLVNIRFGFPRSEMGSTAKLLLFLEKMFKVVINVGENKFRIREASLEKISFDKEGYCTVTFVTDVKHNLEAGELIERELEIIVIGGSKNGNQE